MKLEIKSSKTCKESGISERNHLNDLEFINLAIIL